MPGSISTVTTPALNSAKTSEMKSMLGRTISTSRMPGRTPIAGRPAASRLLSSSSSAKRQRFVLPLAGWHRGPRGMAIAMPSGFVRAVSQSRRPTLTMSRHRAPPPHFVRRELQHERRHIDIAAPWPAPSSRARRSLRARRAGRPCRAADRRPPAGRRRPRRPGGPCRPAQSSGVERLGLRAAADVRPPIERIAPPHGQHPLADHEQPQIAPFVRR